MSSLKAFQSFNQTLSGICLVLFALILIVGSEDHLFFIYLLGVSGLASLFISFATSRNTDAGSDILIPSLLLAASFVALVLTSVVVLLLVQSLLNLHMSDVLFSWLYYFGLFLVASFVIAFLISISRTPNM